MNELEKIPGVVKVERWDVHCSECGLIKENLNRHPNKHSVETDHRPQHVNDENERAEWENFDIRVEKTTKLYSVEVKRID